MTESDFVFDEGNAVHIGSPVDNDFVFARGELVSDTGQSDFAFIRGTGIGGIGDFEADIIDYPINEGSGRTLTNLAPNPDGTIRGNYEWVEEGSPQTGSSRSVQVQDADNGGTDPNFDLVTDDSFTVRTWFRHPGSSGEATYLWNDLDSGSNGFRAFTGGVANEELLVRNAWAGSDEDVYSNQRIDDGDWYEFVVTLDAEENVISLYVNGELADTGDYVVDDHDGGNYTTLGFEAEGSFTTMGSDTTGSSDFLQYDGYQWGNGVQTPGEG